MPDWNFLIDESALAAVLPGDYAKFARPVRAGLIAFLGGLPETHQQQLLAEQTSLPLTAGISERLGHLARSCPVLHKLGQMLARDSRLAPELRAHLRELESLSPTIRQATIRGALVDELGPLEDLGITLIEPAIAEASVAVVVSFRQDDKAGGVFKILKPGIEERMELELDLLSKVGTHLDERCDDLGIPQLDYQDAFDQIRDKLRHEVRLDGEQSNLTHAAHQFTHTSGVQIPHLLPFCTRRVTAMERVTGGKVTDHRLSDPSDHRRLAKLIIRSLVAKPIFSQARHAVFHGDPHAGNLFLTDEGRLAILDWSLVGTLRERDRVAIAQLLMAAILLDAGQIVSILEGLSRRRADRLALASVVQSQLIHIRTGKIPGLSWLVSLLDDAVALAGLRPIADLMIFRKSLHTLEGVIGEISAGHVELDGVLLADFATHFVAELPWRLTAAADSHHFATNLSNSDLTQALINLPAAWSRFWMGRGLDLLDAYCTPAKLTSVA
jgi:ubiquinone biosynthesis protein